MTTASAGVQIQCLILWLALLLKLNQFLYKTGIYYNQNHILELYIIIFCVVYLDGKLK